MRVFLVAAVLFLIGVVTLSPQDSSQTPIGEPTLKVINDLPSLSETTELVDFCSPPDLLHGELRWSRPFNHSGKTQWLRLHLMISHDTSSADWFVEVVGKDGARQRFAAETMRKAKNQGVWSELVMGDSFTMRLHAKEDPSGIRVCIDRYNFQGAQPEIKALIHNRDDRVDLVLKYGTSSRFYEFGRAVAIVYFQDIETSQETNCTGFLLSPTLLITNSHCISSTKQLGTARAEFDYDSSGVQPQTVLITELLANSDMDHLDYSLLRLNRPVGTAVKLSTERPGAKEKFILIQHPNGMPKKIAVKKCAFQSATVPGRPSDFFHLCDSSFGSSGSPVMDAETGAVVGLHHLGATDPRTKTDYHNMAVGVAEILGDIKTQNLSVYKEILDPPGGQSN
jgi:hypothetical protein